LPEIPLGSIDRIIRKRGGSRVKVESSLALRDILEEVGNEIVTKALALTNNRNQQVITKEDILLAFSLYKDVLSSS
jgi:histone H3/H4